MTDQRRSVDRVDVRRHNLSLVLRLLADHGPRSRAAIATVTGLTKATVSSLMAELISRRLARELGPEADRRLGRPATLVQLDGTHVVTLGAEVNVGHIAVLGTDLAGREVYAQRRSLALDASEVDQVIQILASELNRAVHTLQQAQCFVAGVTVAIPGIVDTERGIVTFAPNLAWRGVPLRQTLAALLDAELDIAVFNEANLGALAEHRVGGHGPTDNLVYILASDGVGAGVIVDGVLLLGVGGGAGEIGHTAVQARGRLCTCGSRGCWETLVAARALLGDALPADEAAALAADPALTAAAKVATVTGRAHAKERSVIDGLQTYGKWLGIGLANVINTFNPSVIVLGGFLPDVAPWVLPVAMETVVRNSLAESARACRIELTRLGFSPSALGGAIHAAERIFADPTLVAPG